MTIAAPIARSPRVESPPPEQDPPGTESPLFLVVIADHGEVQQLPVLASLVALSSGRLLVAIASPQMGFTTDAAVLWRAAMRGPRDVAALAAATEQQLAGQLTGYEMLELPYRDSPSAARRVRRIVMAAERLARKRRAIHLSEWFPALPVENARSASY